MTITLVTSLDEAAWRAFVDRQAAGNIFHTPAMQRVFGRVQGMQTTLDAAVDEHGELLALLPAVHITLMNGPLHRLTTRAVLYGGALCGEGPGSRAALQAVLAAHAQRFGRRALFTELRHLSDAAPLRPVLEGCGYEYEEHLDYLIDLSGTPEDVFGRIGARTRKHIRQALRRSDVVVEELSQPDQLGEWYALIQKSYAAARVPLADIALFQAAFHELLPQGMVQFWGAFIGGKMVAASAELPYKDTVYGWYSGVDRAYASECPGELLMWRVLEAGCRAGFRVYDFGGAGKPGEAYGVRDFKAKFGGELVCYGRHRKVHAPGLMRISEMGYALYRRLRR